MSDDTQTQEIAHYLRGQNFGKVMFLSMGLAFTMAMGPAIAFAVYFDGLWQFLAVGWLAILYIIESVWPGKTVVWSTFIASTVLLFVMHVRRVLSA